MAEDKHTSSKTSPTGSVAVTSTVTASAVSPNTRVTKLIVAVHGVGDQYSFATIQSVLNQFCAFFGQPAGIPLGNFHTGEAGFSVPPPYPRDPFERFGFAEVYWAKIPRTIVDEKHTLEEAKKWAHTIVERLKLRWRVLGSQGGCENEDFIRVQLVLNEMIETIAVLDRICKLAEKAGLFTFDLRRLLDDYLGDVQVVTEFTENRNQILDAFKDLLRKAHDAFPVADIYLVAHSEGTVVSLLGLLKAFRETEPPAWAAQVRGMMTLGSPIDKHLLLWPELFGDTPPVVPPPNKIEWRNYYDHGDPIGFALDDARAWLVKHGWTNVFNFTDEKGHDNGFARYPFPGKAHVDYWGDKDVFGHFIQTVIHETPSAAAVADGADFTQPPADLRNEQWLSYVAPYVGIAALCFVAAYLLFKAVTEATNPTGVTGPYPNWAIFKTVTGIAVLIAGMTVVSRVPRLTRRPLWRAITGMVALAAGGVYLWSVAAEAPTSLFGHPILAGSSTIALATLAVWAVYKISDERPSWGLTPLILTGTVVIAGRVTYHLWFADQIGPVWPVFLATAAFLYLWWLGALLFDLVFIWHLYIRHSEMLQRMDEIMGRPPDFVRRDAIAQRRVRVPHVALRKRR
jgi:hypothetical protein